MTLLLFGCIRVIAVPKKKRNDGPTGFAIEWTARTTDYGPTARAAGGVGTTHIRSKFQLRTQCLSANGADGSVVGLCHSMREVMNLSMQEVQSATCDPRELYQQLYARTVISYGRELSTRRGQFLGKSFQIESGQN